MSQTIVNSTTIDDSSPLITYAGASWTVHTNVESIFHLYNNTDTFTDVQGATATLRFYGNAIDYWGNRGPYHGNCLITIDGEDLATANSHADADDTPILLFSTNQLALKDHELVIKVLDPAYPAVCEIDRFVVNVTTNPTTTGLSTNTALYPTGSVASSNTGGGNTGGSSSSPPIAAIAGGVGGAAALCLLLVAFWLCKRSKKTKKNRGTIVTGSKLAKPSVSKPLLSEDPPSPSGMEKNGFRAPQPYPNQPSSYVSSSPLVSSYNPSSPPPSSTGFNPYLLSTSNSPQTGMRPISTVSSTSAAPTSYYSSGAPTTEGGFQGYYPQPPQPLPPQQQQQYQQPQYQQQPAGVAPVWARPEPTSSPPPTHTQHPSVPSPSQSPAPAVMAHPSPSATPVPAPTSFPPEKAQYMPRPEKSGFSGAQAGTAGASGSSAPAPSAGASGSVPTPHSPEIMTTPVPDLPPPAYQF